VTGNSMTAVNPGNLKLIGRATHLIRELVNRALEEAPAETGSGPAPAVTYAEANAVLFDCIENRGTQAIHHAEVALCIIRILETVRAGKFVDWKAADAMLKKGGLDEYLNPKTKK
jgi:N-acetylmuramic acid 6-phosphate etherase